MAVFLFLTIPVFAQEQEILFTNALQPAIIYNSEVGIQMDMIMDIDSDEAREEIKASGMEFPMKLDLEQSFKYIATTEKADELGNFGYAVKYQDYDLDVMINNMEQEIPNSEIMDFSFYGNVTGGKNSIDSISGLEVGPEMEANIENMVTKLFELVSFPDTAIRVGESFKMSMPFDMPMPGFSAYKMFIDIEYTLDKISEGNAYFSLVQELEMDMGSDIMDFNGEGHGTGQIIYDIENKNLTDYESVLNMTMMLKMMDMDMNIDATVNTKHVTKLEKIL